VGRQLAVLEIGDADQEDAERCATGDIIVDAQPIEAVLARHPDDADRGAEDAAVEGHAAVPQLNDLGRVGEVEVRPVEQDIAQPAADQDAERRVEHHIVGMAAGHRRARPADQLQQIPPADQDAEQIA
jgi:hypothetical protein